MTEKLRPVEKAAQFIAERRKRQIRRMVRRISRGRGGYVESAEGQRYAFSPLRSLIPKPINKEQKRKT